MIPVIFVTSLDTIEDRRRGFEAGATDFITKPFKEGELLDAVNRILNPLRRLSGMTALLADAAASRRVVMDCLAREGVSVIETGDGAEAFEIIADRSDEIDIVLTVCRLPGMNGDELCGRIRNELNLQDLPVVFLPHIDDKSMLLELFKAGATDYLVQPFAKEEFLARLTSHLDRSILNKRLRSTLEKSRDIQPKDHAKHSIRKTDTGIHVAESRRCR